MGSTEGPMGSTGGPECPISSTGGYKGMHWRLYG